MTSTTTLNTRPAFMNQWPTAYPRHRGHWTVVGRDTWGALDPEHGTSSVVDPRQDPKLPAMASALQQGNLIGYRIGRRAIIATPDSFIKVVRPGRIEAQIATLHALAASCPMLSIPRVLASNPSGSVDLGPVPGKSLHQLLRTPDPSSTVLAALDDIGIALAAFHSTPPPTTLVPHALDEPTRWVETVSRVEPEAVAQLVEAASDLPAAPIVAHTMVHGDLHDKNVFATSDTVGLIDLDGVALGAPEDDVANLAVHLHLRGLQAGHHPCVGTEHAQRLYSAYQSVRPLDAERLDAVERHTWFRLACLYRFRTRSRDLVAEILRRATRHQR